MTWRFGVSSGACTDRPIREMLPALRAAGATAIEIGTPPRHFDPWQHDQVAGLRDTLDALDLRAIAIHAPFGGLLDLADPNPHHRHAAVSAILTAAAAITQVGGSIVVVHPSDLERRLHDPAPRLADSLRSLLLLADSCRQEGLTLCVETPLPHLIGGAPEEFAWLLERLPDAVGACLDTGHIHLGRHWREFVRIAGGRIRHIHAHDNRGHWDDHLPPGDGGVDWAEVSTTLAAARFDGWIMLELSCPGSDVEAYFRRALERAAVVFGSAPADRL